MVNMGTQGISLNLDGRPDLRGARCPQLLAHPSG